MSTFRRVVGINSGDPTMPRLLEGIAAPPEWTLDALCAQVDPELFYPERGANAAPAKAVCRRCPVRVECLDYALAYEAGEFGVLLSYPAGIYGGLTERERTRLRRARRSAWTTKTGGTR